MDNFGLALLKKAYETEIKTKADKIVVIVHWCLLNRGLRQSGSGDNFSVDDGSVSELLPGNWNLNDNYTFKYRQASNLPNKFVLKVLIDNDIANVIVLRVSDEKTTNTSVDLSKEVQQDLSMSDEKEFLNKISNDLLEELLPTKKEESPEAKKAKVTTEAPPRPQEARNPHIGPTHNPLAVGGADLDPFGNPMGGGMLMDPRGMNRPRAPNPLGPRFDPVYPGMPNPGLGPSGPMGPYGPRFGGGRPGGNRNYGDEMPPPGYDDMFM